MIKQISISALAPHLVLNEQDARIEAIEAVCENLEIPNYAVRGYSNACSVTLMIDGSYEIIVLVEHKDKAADITAIIARAAGIPTSRAVKSIHAALSDVIARMEKKAADIDGCDQ